MGRNINPRPQFLDSAGDPLISGKMYYFESGTDTPKATFADVNMTIQNTHPVILTGDGRLPNVFLIGTARMKLTDADDVQLWDIDPTGGDDIGGNFEEWVPSVVYNANDIVQGSDGKFYLSFTNGNLGNDPTTTPTEWQEIQFINVWNTNVTYQIGNTVIGSDNLFYVSQTADNLGNDPTSDAINWGPPFDAVVSITGGTGITISGTASVPIVTADNNGTVTSVATAGLATGGPITGTGTVTVPKAIASEVATGTDDTKAVTSLAMADALLGANNLSGVADPAASATNLGLGTGDAVAFATVNTGNGDNELFAMDQDVKTTDDVTFNSVAGVAQTDCQLVYNSTTEIQLMMAGGKFVTVNGSPLDISSEPTLANTGLTAGDTLYGYLFDDGGTPTIELSTTVPAAGADGIDIKTGDATRTYVGIVFMDAGAPGTFANTEKKRWVWSKYNARPLDALAIRTAGNFTTASTTLVDATDMELSIVLGEAATVRFDWPLTFSNNSAGAEMRFNIEIDNTTLIFGTAGLAADATTAAQSYAIALGGDTAELAAGEHTIKGQWSASAGTGTIKATTTRPSRMTATEIR